MRRLLVWMFTFIKRKQVQLKVADNGRGFQQMMMETNWAMVTEYQRTFEDMAGTIQLLTAPKQGLAVGIHSFAWSG